MRKTIILFILLIIPISVNAATCESITVTRQYYDGTSWNTFTANPLTSVSDFEKIKIIYNNNTIQNKAIILNGHYIIQKDNPINEDLSYQVLLKDGTSSQDITNKCSFNGTNSCTNNNDSLCIYSSNNVNMSCNFNSTLSNANSIEVILSVQTGYGNRFYMDNNCLQINPTDTQQIIESQNNNGNQITDAINDNGEEIDHELESINETISDMFQNMGSCREQPHLIMKHNYKLDSSGNEVADNNYGISGYIRVYKDTQINRTTASTDQVYMCFYGNNNQLISCETERQVVGVTIPANTYYVRYTWSQVDEKPRIDMCSKSNDMTQQTLDQMAEDLNKFREDYNNSQQVCDIIDKEYSEIDNKYLTRNGSMVDNNAWVVTKYINILDSTIRVLNINSRAGYTCFYDPNKILIGQCINQQTFAVNDILEIPNNAKYMRYSIVKDDNKPQYEICKNSGDALYMTLTDSGNGNGLGGLNMTDTNATLNKESQLMNNTFNTNTINITYDQTAWSWVFTQMTRILETNSLIMGMVITVLSIGLIKTVMGR